MWRRLALRLLPVLLLASVRPAAGKKKGARCDFRRLDGTGFGTDDFRRQFRMSAPGEPVVLTGLQLGPGLRAGKGGSGWSREVLRARHGAAVVESQDAVVYNAFSGAAAGDPKRTGLGAATPLGDILKEPGSTLFLLKPHHAALADLGQGLEIPPALAPLQLTGPTLSVGGAGAASPFHEHPENWFAMLQGRKAWVVHPPGNVATDFRHSHPCQLAEGKPKPKLPKAAKRCVLQEGEVLYLPSNWTHGTCNLDDFVMGIGYIGQLDHLPPLHHAAAVGNASLVRELMSPERLASVDPEGKVPLHWAAHRGHAALVKLLLASKADAGSRDGNGAQPLHLAAFEGHAGAVKALLKGRKALALGETRAGAQPMHLAASRGHTAAAKLLLGAGASASGRDAQGAEPLHMAAYEGHLAMVDLLLSKGADAGTKAKDGTAASQLARKRGHRAVVERLAGGRGEL